jgi:DNA-binding ferritin-like protein
MSWASPHDAMSQSPKAKFVEHVGALMAAQNQVRVFHWGARSYGRHKVLDELYKDLNELIDEYVEAGLGLYGLCLYSVRLPQSTFNTDIREVGCFLNYLQRTIEELRYTCGIDSIDGKMQEFQFKLGKIVYLYRMS